VVFLKGVVEGGSGGRAEGRRGPSLRKREILKGITWGQSNGGAKKISKSSASPFCGRMPTLERSRGGCCYKGRWRTVVG